MDNTNDYISSYFVDHKEINLNDYDGIFVKEDNIITIRCLDFLCKKQVINEINIIEEGINSYCNEVQTNVFIDKYPRIKVKLWLYDKELLMFKNEKLSIQEIPKIRFNDLKLKVALNHIFNFDNINQNYNNSIIYFEQVSEPMPNYLLNAGWFKRIVLANAYRKHMREQHLYEEKCKVIDLIISNIVRYTGIKFFIKLHPRTVNGMPDKYGKFIWEDNSSSNIPWELYFLNCSFHNSMWITTASGAVTNALYCFYSDIILKIGLTYKLDDDYEKYLNKNLNSFYEKLNDRYQNIEIYKDSSALDRGISAFLHGGE